MQKELNLTVGQKVWSIQLGDCEVIEIANEEYGYIVEGKDGGRYSYDKSGRYSNRHVNPSLFESNPFEPKLVQEHKDGWIEPKENKAELIKALANVCNVFKSGQTYILASNKLLKLLESI